MSDKQSCHPCFHSHEGTDPAQIGTKFLECRERPPAPFAVPGPAPGQFTMISMYPRVDPARPCSQWRPEVARLPGPQAV